MPTNPVSPSQPGQAGPLQFHSSGKTQVDLCGWVHGDGKVREIRISEFHVGSEERATELKKREVKDYKPM
jgi:hypothetical protein